MKKAEIILSDALLFLNRLADNSCDIFTDPPYNVGKDYGVSKDDMTEAEYTEWITNILSEGKRVASVLTVYVPKKWNLLYWNVLGTEFQEIILPFSPRGAIRSNFSNQYNKLLTNARPSTKTPVLNVWENMQQPGLGYFFRENTYGHPGYTSQHISERVVRELCKSDIICDPFAGTGSVAVAALKYGKSFIGSENNPAWIKIAEKRISKLTRNLFIAD